VLRQQRCFVAVLVALVLTGVCGAAALGLAGCSGSAAAQSGASRVYPTAERHPVPVVSGELLDGGSYELSAHRGEVVVLNFWASWCAPCRAEAAELTAVAEATRGERVTFLGIDIRDDRDKARAFLAAHQIGYPSLFDPSGTVVLGFTEVPPTTIPATLIVDRQGRIAAVFLKALLREDLEPVVRQIAAEH